MEREKMIEEMAMLLCKDICFRKICAVTNHCQIKNCKMREKATLLNDFIYKRINDFIPEGAVVVSHSDIEKGDDYGDLSELLTEFDRMDYLPKNFCNDAFAEAKDFQKRLSALIIRIIARANDAEVKAINSKEQTRKETAKDILCEFSKLQWGQSELDNVCIRIAEKYGVEVE